MQNSHKEKLPQTSPENGQKLPELHHELEQLHETVRYQQCELQALYDYLQLTLSPSVFATIKTNMMGVAKRRYDRSRQFDEELLVPAVVQTYS